MLGPVEPEWNPLRDNTNSIQQPVGDRKTKRCRLIDAYEGECAHRGSFPYPQPPTLIGSAMASQTGAIAEGLEMKL